MPRKTEETITSFKIWDRESEETEVHELEKYVVDGEEEGPHIVVVSGSHGDELLAIDAAKQVYRSLDVEEVAGKVSFVPEANMFAVAKGTRETPVPEFEIYEDEERNLNRCFSSVDLDEGVDGNLTQRLAYHILELVADADYCFDLHTATAPGYKINQIREKTDRRFDSEVRREQERLVRNSGVSYVLRTSSEDIGRGVLAGVAPGYGVPTVTVEIGGGMYTTTEIEEYVDVVENLLSTAGVLEGEEKGEEPGLMEKLRRGSGDGQRVYRDLVKISAPTAGSYTKAAPPGETIEKGEVLGRIENDEGVHEVESPCDGLVESVHREEWVNEGTKLGHIAIREEMDPVTHFFRALSRILDSLLSRASGS
ncbi:MAG: succinylglutamate desuccinylase/aspartoacylase family protein [Candidatus Nanohaloarchaea archaeon]|nr:succinylglutamate desuccinylase/aspartoacylase family protein [Candidatus Nanohaloarchaea archaeon]